MDSFKYIHAELERLSKCFPQVHIKYGFRDTINCHIVELLPLEEYHNNKDLDEQWIPWSFTFRELYPSEDIVFVSSESRLSVKEPIFELNAHVSRKDA